MLNSHHKYLLIGIKISSKRYTQANRYLTYQNSHALPINDRANMD